MKGGNMINPDNPKQARVFYYLQDAPFSPGKLFYHPQRVMKRLSKELNFIILDSIPQTIADGWDFWIEFETMPELPPFISNKVPWKPVGES